MNDPLKPSLELLVKLGSIAVHAEEMNSYGFARLHEFEHDRAALQTLFDDAEVVEWVGEMTELAMLPVKRTERTE